MIEIKNLFTKSLLAGVCLGIGVFCGGYLKNDVIQGILVALMFFGMIEMNYPLITERWGDARLMTTFMGYITPDAFKLRLILRKIIPGNIIGLLLSTAVIMIVSPQCKILTYEIVDMSWWQILLSSVLTGLILDISSKSYRMNKTKWIMLIGCITIASFGLNHFLVDVIRVTCNIINDKLEILSALKIVVISAFGNFLGSRIRTLIVKDEETN